MSGTFHTEREKERLVRLAAEYQDRGYAVIILPNDDFLPSALQGLVLGIVATRGEELLLADVRSRDHLTLNGAADLPTIAKQLEQLPNAAWELVVINPENQQEEA